MMKMVGRFLGIIAFICAIKWGGTGLFACLLIIGILWGLFEFLTSAVDKELKKSIEDKKNGTSKWK
ncbi:hypothetical protein ABFY54_29160 [Priestia megaterium]|uniref:hypothetical protein n=1 Tax=Priestia megaterium TaxID=1404 RepID=UPI003D2A8395